MLRWKNIQFYDKVSGQLNQRKKLLKKSPSYFQEEKVAYTASTFRISNVLLFVHNSHFYGKKECFMHFWLGDKQDFLFFFPADGRVLKAVNAGTGDKIHSTVIEDLQVLEKDEPVTELKVFRQRGEERLIVISKKNLVSIPLHRCHRHKRCG